MILGGAKHVYEIDPRLGDDVTLILCLKSELAFSWISILYGFLIGPLILVCGIKNKCKYSRCPKTGQKFVRISDIILVSENRTLMSGSLS